MSLFSVEPMFHFSVIFNISILKIADANISENLIQPHDPRFTKLLATQYGCSKQYNLRQIRLTRVQK